MKTVKNWVLCCAFAAFLSPAAALFANNFTVLHTFGGNADGALPDAGVALCGGTFYGVTYQGDNGSGFQFGTVYSVSTNGSNYAILHSFTGSDGQNPQSAPLVAGGMIYGTTYKGGSNDDGAIYCMCTNGSNYTVLHAFDEGSGGKSPEGDLLLVNDTLYGFTAFTGTNAVGAVYSINTNGGNYNIVCTFTNLPNNGQPTPNSRLAFSGTTLYGVTTTGGANNFGVIFSVCTNGSNFTVLHQFTTAEGQTLRGAPLILGNVLYGCTGNGATNGSGAIYSVGLDGGNFQDFYAFASNTAPSTLFAVSSNTVYGSTDGTLYSVSTDGTGYQALHSFSNANATNGFLYNSDGVYAIGSLLCGSNIFGVASEGGTNGMGTLYQLTFTAPTNTPPPQTNQYIPFFTGQISLGNNVYWLGPKLTDTCAFGYYSMEFYPYVYHYDMGWEYCFDAANAKNGVYFYDFTDGVFLYTEPGLFPYIYDFHLGAWMYYSPVSGATDRYTSNPRWFFNTTTQAWINDL